jgi:hypothetical protein
MESSIVIADGPRMAKRMSMDMETGETTEHMAEDAASAAPPGVQKKVCTPAARGASKPLLVAVAFIAVIAIFGCTMAVYAVTNGGAAMATGGAVSTQDFLAHKVTTKYEAGAQRIIGTAMHHLTMHPACMQSAANHKVSEKKRREETIFIVSNRYSYIEVSVHLSANTH